MWGSGRGSGLGVRVNVNGEVKFFEKFKTKKMGGGVGSRGSGCEGSQGRCERRSEVFVNIQQKKIGGVGGSGRAVGLRGELG